MLPGGVTQNRVVRRWISTQYGLTHYSDSESRAENASKPPLQAAEVRPDPDSRLKLQLGEHFWELLSLVYTSCK